jgi:hypothetical protein
MEMKICSSCEKNLPVSDFYSNGFDYKKKRKYKPWCSACEYKRQRARLDKVIIDHFGGARCQRCGYDKCFRALECHHLDSANKDMGIARMVTASKARLAKELAKCILVCANCHREIHHMI